MAGTIWIHLGKTSEGRRLSESGREVIAHDLDWLLSELAGYIDHKITESDQLNKETLLRPGKFGWIFTKKPSKARLFTYR